MPVEATRAAVPADNLQNPEKIALGEELFFDGRLSVDGTVACSTCTAGDKNAIGDSAKRGWKLFNSKARCNKCHALSEDKPDPTYLMDKDFHNIGIGIIRHSVVAEACKAEQQIDSGNLIDVDRAAIQSDMSVLGRLLVTKKEADIASFKTPGLRNVLVTAPYFHDGSQVTLWDVLDHYNKGDGIRDPWLDQDIEPLALSEADR